MRHVASIATMGVAFAASVIGPNPLPDPNVPFIPDTNVPGGGGGTGGGGGGGGFTPTTPIDPGTGVGGGHVAGETMTTSGSLAASTPSGTSGGGAGGGAAAGGGGGSLPFTGYGLALVVGAGMTMTAAGKLLRRAARR